MRLAHHAVRIAHNALRIAHNAAHISHNAARFAHRAHWAHKLCTLHDTLRTSRTYAVRVAHHAVRIGHHAVRIVRHAHCAIANISDVMHYCLADQGLVR